MTNAEHCLQWALNSQEHAIRLKGLRSLVSLVGGSTGAFNALKLAQETYRAMWKGGDADKGWPAQDILQAAVLMLEWEYEE